VLLDAGKNDISKDLHTRGCFAADSSFLSLDHGFLRVTSPEWESHLPGTVRALSLQGWSLQEAVNRCASGMRQPGNPAPQFPARWAMRFSPSIRLEPC
jgi:hypothetical protein